MLTAPIRTSAPMTTVPVFSFTTTRALFWSWMGRFSSLATSSTVPALELGRDGHLHRAANPGPGPGLGQFLVDGLTTAHRGGEILLEQAVAEHLVVVEDPGHPRSTSPPSGIRPAVGWFFMWRSRRWPGEPPHQDGALAHGVDLVVRALERGHEQGAAGQGRWRRRWSSP